jgi:hypothetical protein
VAQNPQRQPYIVAVGGVNDVQQYYVVVDNSFVAVNTLLRAFEVLYKCYWIFDLDYLNELGTFFNFFDLYIYKLFAAVPKLPVTRLYDLVKLV